MLAVVGILVGGASRRMGGRPKGLLRSPDTDEPLVARTVRVARDAGLEAFLVGDATAYRDVVPGIPRIADQPAGIGPLGGLGGLLAAAGGRGAIAVGCDMPYLSADILGRLAGRVGNAPVVAPRRGPGEPFEPLMTLYDALAVKPVLDAALRAGVRSFWRVLAGLRVEELVLTESEREALRDWDRPEDIPREPLGSRGEGGQLPCPKPPADGGSPPGGHPPGSCGG